MKRCGKRKGLAPSHGAAPWHAQESASGQITAEDVPDCSNASSLELVVMSKEKLVPTYVIRVCVDGA
jgi:hypothetical protein